MDILTLEGTEIYINSLGLQDQKLIYRTELKNEKEAAAKIEKYLIVII
ncbi:phage protein [Staphylococcus aureus]|nr:phage protein [Staphylococcus aureus]